MGRPVVLVTTWRRTVATPTDSQLVLDTVAPGYTEGVREAGGLPLALPRLDRDELTEALALADGVVITGGYDVDPVVYGADNTSSWLVERAADEADAAVVTGAIERELPLLGICRSAQMVNVALGGDLRQEIQEQGSDVHPTYREIKDDDAIEDIKVLRHPVRLAPDSRLARIHDTTDLTVNSLHHQAIGRVADGLRVAAESPDGVIEAVEGIDADVVAVQWHPEMIRGEGGAILFADLIERTNR